MSDKKRFGMCIKEVIYYILDRVRVLGIRVFFLKDKERER